MAATTSAATFGASLGPVIVHQWSRSGGMRVPMRLDQTGSPYKLFAEGTSGR
jgi:hypothetical protein